MINISGMCCREADDDGRNRKLMLFEADTLASSPVWHSWFPCSLHSNNKLIGSSCSALGLHLVNAMFCYAKLLRTANFWVRTVLSGSAIVQEELFIIQAQCPADIAAERSLMMEFLFSHPCAGGMGRSHLHLLDCVSTSCVNLAAKHECI